MKLGNYSDNTVSYLGGMLSGILLVCFLGWFILIFIGPDINTYLCKETQIECDSDNWRLFKPILTDDQITYLCEEKEMEKACNWLEPSEYRKYDVWLDKQEE